MDKYQGWSKIDLQEELRLYDVEAEGLSIKGMKEALADLTRSESETKPVPDNLADEYVEAITEDEDENVTESDNTPPTDTDVEYSDYVLSLIAESEKVKGFPKVAGLRRAAKMLIGPIGSSKVVGYHNNTGVVTVEYLIVFNTLGYNVEYGDVADAVQDTLPQQFRGCLSAVASTRAEARALRKALGLNIISAEEASFSQSAEAESAEDIDNTQITIIDNLARKRKIDVLKLAVARKIDPKTQPDKLIEAMNEVRGEVPLEYKGYKSGWSESLVSK